ncbi:MAG: TetR/AcrR family transcriptional regulator [Acidimicrobiales bacterium]
MALGPSTPAAVDLAAALAGLSESPGQHLDHFLDAAARCFTRHGIRRTTVQDVAREAGVDRTTVYRQVGNIERMARLLAAREARRIGHALVERVQLTDPDALVDAAAWLVPAIRTHPVLAKAVHDDPHSVATVAMAELPYVIERAAEALTPVLDRAMEDGVLARRDPTVLAQWLVRVGAMLVAMPPHVSLRPLLAEMLLPVLRPSQGS